MKSTKEEFLEILSNYQGILHKVSLIYFKNKADRETEESIIGLIVGTHWSFRILFRSKKNPEIPITAS